MSIERITGLWSSRATGRRAAYAVTHDDTARDRGCIMWAGGLGAGVEDYQPLADWLAALGFTFATMDWNDTRGGGGGPGGVRDWRSDLIEFREFVDARADFPFIKRRTPCAVGGHSAGAQRAMACTGARFSVGGDLLVPPAAVPGVRCALLLSPQGQDETLYTDATSWASIEVPVLYGTGTLDVGRDGQPWQWRLEPYRLGRNRPRGVFVVEEGGHTFGALTGRDKDGPPDTQIQEAVVLTVDNFLARYLEPSMASRAGWWWLRRIPPARFERLQWTG